MLKEFNPAVKCYIVEPETCAVYAGREITNANHKIQGGGYSMPELKFISRDRIDGFVKISNDEAILTAWRLAREEGIFAGFSSGADVCAAMKLLQDECKGKTIVVLCCDSGLKYLSTDLWEEMTS